MVPTQKSKMILRLLTNQCCNVQPIVARRDDDDVDDDDDDDIITPANVRRGRKMIRIII